MFWSRHSFRIVELKGAICAFRGGFRSGYIQYRCRASQPIQATNRRRLSNLGLYADCIRPDAPSPPTRYDTPVQIIKGKPEPNRVLRKYQKTNNPKRPLAVSKTNRIYQPKSDQKPHATSSSCIPSYLTKDSRDTSNDVDIV